MHKRFSFLLVFGLMASTLLSAQIGITDTGEGGGKKPSPEKPLTNTEIIQMVRSGRAEATIVAAIRASRKNFDLSKQGCQALNQAHVSRTILNTMGAGSQACNMTLDAAPGTPSKGSRGGMLTPGQSGGMLSNPPSQQPAVNGPGKLLNNQNGSSTLLSNGNKQAPAVVGTAVVAQPNLRTAGAGTVEGFVFWDTASISHNPASSCSGLAVTVAVGNSSGGKSNAYDSLATLTNNFKFVGQVKQFVTGGKIKVYDVCTYGYGHVPVGPDLRVTVIAEGSSLSQAGPFSPASVPKIDPIGPINIINGQCNMLPRIMNPTASDLFAHWGSCQNMAFDVNFMMEPEQQAPSNGGKAGPPATRTQKGMLNNEPPQGMLASGAGSHTQTPSTEVGLLGNHGISAPPTPGSKVELNPQPLPPKAKGVPPVRTLKPVKLAPPTALRKITNPRSAELNAGIIAVLRQQRQAAEQEASAMKLGIRSAASARTSAVAASLQGNAAAQGLMPSRIQSASGNTSAAIKSPAVFNSVVLSCTNDPTPRIMRVSGGEAPGIFSPDAKFNLYTIAGCSFGPSAAGNAAYIFGANGFHQNLNIDFWSENGITAHLDPSLAGVLDQNNITLVVTPAGKQQLQKSGFQFYAARGMPLPDGTVQEVPVPYDSAASSKVALFNADPFLAGFDQLPSNAVSTFPSFSFQGAPVAGWTFRYLFGHADRISTFRSHDCFINDVGYDGDRCHAPLAVPVKPDTWDFSKFAPGFAISSYSLYYEDIDPASLCGAATDLNHSGSINGKWDFNLNEQNQIVVTWPTYSCSDTEFGTRDNFAEQSAYGVAVWVLGPRCVDPWTGQKDQACMAKVKQMLS